MIEITEEEAQFIIDSLLPYPVDGKEIIIKKLRRGIAKERAWQKKKEAIRKKAPF